MLYNPTPVQNVKMLILSSVSVDASNALFMLRNFFTKVERHGSTLLSLGICSWAYTHRS
jgi:hypothetical protein